jgi:putative ABC transport system permease protein
MKHAETFKTAFQSLLRNKVRAFLTMLGIIIGVFSVVTLIALVRGFENYITDQFDALGSNLIFVTPGNVAGNSNANPFSNNQLAEKHIAIINNYAGDFISGVTPSLRIGKTVYYRTDSYFSTIAGGNYQVFEILGLKVEEGRPFNKAEETSSARVAVIGPLVADNLFSNKSPLGERVKIDDESFEVIGITESKGTDFDDRVFVPYTTVKDTFGLDKFSAILVKAKDADRIDESMREVKTALLRDLKSDVFSVLSQKDILSSIQSILSVLSIGLGAIAGISLLVGGIGIMNIMLVSVTERTKEIGLRKALGATPFNIGSQFLIESIILSASGGALGLGLGWLASQGARVFLRTEIPWWSVAVAFGFSLLVGIVFGTYPAVKASKKDPIEALRYE